MSLHPNEHQVQSRVDSINYVINKGSRQILLTVRGGRISLRTNQNLEEFKFVGSRPDMVKTIAELMLEAVRVCETSPK